jgi:uncharacterized glyoxalase superfamily protein PhnB
MARSLTPFLMFQRGVAEELDRVFVALSEGGRVLMPPDNYGFSERFTWTGDRFGVSWQLDWRG